MSLTHELRLLELDSQVELLERLQLLTNFGSNLVTLTGKTGSGRSWLAQRYLEAWSTEKNQCLLLCHPSQDDQQRRALILSQIVPDPLFNQDDSLSDSLARLLDGEACNVVIVVDDAHRLSELLVSELWTLLIEAQSNPQWTINIVLFSNIGYLNPLLTRLSYGQQHKPIDLEIDNLSQPEAEHFFESLVIRYVDDESEARVRRAFNKAQPLPGELMALGKLKVEKRIIIRSIIGSPINIAIVVTLLLIVISGGYWWMFSQPTPDDKVQSFIAPVEQTVIPTVEVVNDIEQADINSKVDSETAADISYQDADDDSSSLPPVVVEGTASVGEVNQEQQRVVIASDVVDALLDDKLGAVDTSAIDAAVEEDRAAAASSPPDTAENKLPLSVEQDSDRTQATPPTKIITFSFARKELQAISPRAYTLQLSAMKSLEDVQSFIEEYEIEDKVRIYPTLRDDTKWFIITYQEYPTIQVARDAVSSLPKGLQQLEPWAKSMNQVHREIERAK